MKLVRFGHVGEERPGVVGPDNRIYDLSAVVDDINGASLSKAELARIAATDIGSLTAVEDGVRIGPCVGNVGNFIAVGLNYADHAKETGSPIPSEPVVFSKTTSCISGANDDILIPPRTTKLDWEVEIAMVIGTAAWQVDEKNALEHVAGYCVCNDVSERAFQNERGGQWLKGKSAPSFGPIGPWLVTSDEIADPQALDLWLDVNGTRRQTGNTRTMIFPLATLISYISQFMKLMPGDVVTTGTPPGVGLGMKPPQFLKAGDVVTLGIEGLGAQRQTVVG